MKSNGQIAYEGYFKACGGRSLISKALLPNWDGLDVLIKDAWEHAAKAVLDAQWKPASEPPNDTRDVLVEAGAWYRGAWFGANGQIIRPIIRWRELPPMPKQEGEV